MRLYDTRPSKQLARTVTAVTLLPAFQVVKPVMPMFLDGTIKEATPYYVTYYVQRGGLRWWQKLIIYPVVFVFLSLLVGWFLGIRHPIVVNGKSIPLPLAVFIIYLVVYFVNAPFFEEVTLDEHSELTTLGAFRLAATGEEP